MKAGLIKSTRVLSGWSLVSKVRKRFRTFFEFNFIMRLDFWAYELVMLILKNIPEILNFVWVLVTLLIPFGWFLLLFFWVG